MDHGRLLLLRHAERPPMPDEGTGDELAITAEGADAARDWGRARSGEIVLLHTSPIRRAQETAEAIGEGAGIEVLAASPWLGRHGPFVADPGPAWAAYRELGAKELIRRLLAGSVGPGFHEPVAASARFLEAMLDPVEERGGLHVAVSHDLIIAGLLGALLGEALDDEAWPEFLEGAELGLLPGRRLRIHYRGQTYEVDRPA